MDNLMLDMTQSMAKRPANVKQKHWDKGHRKVSKSILDRTRLAFSKLVKRKS